MQCGYVHLFFWFWWLKLPFLYICKQQLLQTSYFNFLLCLLARTTVQHYFSDSLLSVRGSIKARQKAMQTEFHLPYFCLLHHILNPTPSFGQPRSHKELLRREKRRNHYAIYKPLRAILKSLQSNSPCSALVMTAVEGRRWSSFWECVLATRYV